MLTTATVNCSELTRASRVMRMLPVSVQEAARLSR